MEERDLVRVAIVCGGSRGDFEPYLALAEELRERGHEPTLVAYRPYEQRVRRAGIRFSGISGDPGQIVGELVKAGHSPLAFAGSFRRVIEPTAELNAQEIFEGCLGSDCVVYASVAFLGYIAAAQLGVPAFAANMQPAFDPTGEFPSSIAPLEPPILARLGRKASYWVARQLFWQTFRPLVGRVWRKRGLAGNLPRLRGPFELMSEQGVPSLCAWSPAVLPQPRDWNRRIVVTGYWWRSEDNSWEAPRHLKEFLGGGPPPVAVSFSSVVPPGSAEALFGRVLDAVGAAGKRAVVVAGWSGLHARGGSSEAVVVEEAPFEWLLPRVSAVVIHGGAGTVAASLRAGKPAVVVPFSADQRFWGTRLAGLGAGVNGPSARDLRTEEVAAALRSTDDGGMRSSAARLAAEIRREDGRARAAEVIERYLERGCA